MGEIDTTDAPDLLAHGLLIAAYACAIGAACVVANAFAVGAADQQLGFGFRAIQAGNAAGGAGLFTLLAGVAAVARPRLTGSPGPDRRLLFAAAGVAVVAAALVAAGIWSHLAVHVSLPSNLNETFGVTTSGPDDYPLSFRLSGVFEGLAALAPLAATLLIVWRGASRPAVSD